MINGFGDMRNAGKDGLEASFESFGALSRGLQTLASESTEFTKRSFEESASHFERLAGLKSVEAAVAAQSEFAKSAYDRALGQANRIGELYVGMVKDAAKPFGAFVPGFAK